MGCSQSKIENEEAVVRCKERKLFMKEAVSFRNAFAAAHSSYATYLKSTGAALSDFAQGEVQHPELASAACIPSAAAAITAAPQHFEIPPPPPLSPLSDISSLLLQRAASMPEMMPKPQLKPVGTIAEEEGEEEENELENDGRLSGSLRRRSSRRSGGGGGGGGGSSRSGTKGLEQEETRPSKPETHVDTHPMPQPPESGAWEYFFPSMENVAGTSLKEAEEDHLNKEEKIERKVFDEKPNRVDAAVDEAMRRERDDDEVPKPVPMPEEEAVEPPAAMAVAPAGKGAKKVKQASGASVEGKRMVSKNKNVNLIQIFTDLDDHFLKASKSAHEVSKLLEATRMHYHSNFADNRGHIDHSARVMRVITWNRCFRGIPNLDDGKDDFDLEELEIHATVLDKLLAWEKKLYYKVKLYILTS